MIFGELGEHGGQARVAVCCRHEVEEAMSELRDRFEQDCDFEWHHRHPDDMRSYEQPQGLGDPVGKLFGKSPH